ncbi:unnamed protein product [Lactuca saligna]|uniref:PB1 domain-containing protein n=1 Tax=Lactuca saligna TaxID=75948 RepID=A0AA35Y923_LACSI|nr:unnamed protein product [Lactuca saligna]
MHTITHLTVVHNDGEITTTMAGRHGGPRDVSGQKKATPLCIERNGDCSWRYWQTNPMTKGGRIVFKNGMTMMNILVGSKVCSGRLAILSSFSQALFMFHSRVVTTSVSHMASSSIMIRVKFVKTLRCFSASINDNNLALDTVALREKIRSLFNFNPDVDFTFTYVDEDGYAVTLADDCHTPLKRKHKV